MSVPLTESGELEVHTGGISRRTRWFVLGAFVAILLLVLCSVIFMRPVARINRLLPTVGLARVPASARNVRVHKRKKLLSTRATYIRFEASADSVAQFVEACSMVTSDGPTPMASLSFGSRCPPWMRWETTVQGRMYHWTADRASVWLAIDDQSHTVYVGIFESRSPWLRRILN